MLLIEIDTMIEYHNHELRIKVMHGEVNHLVDAITETSKNDKHTLLTFLTKVGSVSYK